MSEEIQNATVTVPQAMLLSISINGLLGLGMLLAILFCLGNVEEILKFPYPFMAIFNQAVDSVKGTLAMSSIIVILTLFTTIAVVASASRMTWSFARDRGLPG